MAEDPYSILGVPRTASDDDIRKAYRRLAKELHPDLNAGKNSEERFKRVTSANDLLSDPDRRRRYDRGEIDANGEPRHHAGPRPGARPGGARGGRGFDDFGFSDVFTDIFGADRNGRTAGMRGADVRYLLDVEFLEAINGTKKRVTMPDGGVLDLNVPEGVQDGQVLRLKGKGERGVEPGDALVEVRVKSHPVFKRTGDDVTFEVPVTIDEAVLGGKIEVATVAGRVQLTLPRATSSGQTFRLKGKGVRNASTGVTGDSLVSIRIVMPDAIDEGLAYFMSEWRQKHKYDPGRG